MVYFYAVRVQQQAYFIGNVRLSVRPSVCPIFFLPY